MIEIIKEEAIKDHIPIIMDDTLNEISKILIQEKPKQILEIGTAVGYSAICFSKFLHEYGKIDTIEIDEVRAKKAIDNIRKMNLEKKINVIIGNAIEIMPTLTTKYDIIFIDAAKGKYPIFFKASIRLLNTNGIIIADNVLYKGYVLGEYNKHKQRTAVTNLREYIKLVTEDKNLETKILDIGDGIAITRKKGTASN